MHNKIRKCFLIIFILAFTLSCNVKKQTLHLYNWVDYIDPEVILQFEKEMNCSVIIKYFDSNEELKEQLASGVVCDVAIPSSFMAMQLQKYGLLHKLDRNKLPGLINLDTDFMLKHPDQHSEYTVPYMMSFIGIGYDSRMVKNFKPTWGQFGRHDLKNKITILDEMRPAIGAALKYLGFSINSTSEREIALAGDVVIGWKKNIARYAVDDAKTGLASGELYLVHNYSGDILQLQKENEYLLFAIPSEGTSINDDDLVIPVSAVNVDLAYSFINFLLRPDICAKNMSFICYLAPNPEAVKLMPASFRSNKSIFPDNNTMSKCEVMRDLGKHNEKYLKTWKKINAADK